jgi:hypothetical protein
MLHISAICSYKHPKWALEIQERPVSLLPTPEQPGLSGLGLGALPVPHSVKGILPEQLARSGFVGLDPFAV